MRLKDLACLRQVVYRLLSSALLYPDEKRLQTLAMASAELHQQSHAATQYAFFPQWKRLLAALADPPQHGSLEEEYLRLLTHGQGGETWLPYESAQLDPSGQAVGWVLALLEREYAAVGVALSPSMKEPPDHAAVELEFMAFLCGREADAWERKAIPEGIQTLESQDAFLRRHLTRWIPEWAHHVETAAGKGFYSAVAGATRAFISHDGDLIAILLDRSREMRDMAQSQQADSAAREGNQRLGSYHHAQ